MKLIIFDGNSILNRAFYAIRALSTKDGFFTNGIYGFLNIYFKFLKEQHPDYVCVAFDLPGKTFRHTQYENYKANRKGMPDELAAQLPVLKDILSAMNIKILTAQGYEADDILGTVSRLCDESAIDCEIVTGDRDNLQLISDHTKVLLTTTSLSSPKTECFDEQAFLDQYGFSPIHLIDLKSLMGDSSDNIPGVAGIGQKTASALIAKYKSIQTIYEDINNLPEKEKLKQKLTEGKELAFLSYSLATIKRDVPLDFSFEETKIRPYNEKALKELFARYEFSNFLSRLDISCENNTQESCSRNVTNEELVLLAESIQKEKVFYYLMDEDGLYLQKQEESLKISSSLDGYHHFVFTLLCDPSVKKYTWGLKEHIKFLLSHGQSYENYAFDCETAAYLLDPSQASYRMEKLISSYLNSHTDNYGQAIAYLVKLCALLEEKITEFHQQGLYFQVELPLCEVLASMEHTGFLIDRAALYAFGEMLDEKITEDTKSIYALCGVDDFNINSTKQLGDVLFNVLNLPVIKKNKTGPSTDSEVLLKLAPYHEVIPLILDYRQLTKLKSTYVTGLLEVIDEPSGRIHTTFQQTITQTGRLSSTNPNLQNIPIRTELGSQIRKVFVAKDGYTLTDADYSQIELRLLAHISGDEAMIHAFLNNEDIHTATASQVFKVPKDDVTPIMRRNAKAVNFGIVYGIGAFSLAEDIKVSRKEAAQYIEDYLSTYKGVKTYLDETVAQAQQDGYVTTMFGRRRYIPELASPNRNVYEFGRRCAMNTPIQGTAADIIKIAMVKVYHRLLKEGLSSRLILQIHDELIIETKEDEKTQVRAILKEEMEQAAALLVPLSCDIHEGKSWYDAKG